MGSRERRIREKRDLREKILKAAQEIITQEGFDALSMRKLANRIDYSAASIYLHFGSREEIAQELAKTAFDQLLVRIKSAAEVPELRDRLHAISHAYISFALEHPETYRLIFMGDAAYMHAVFKEEGEDSPARQSYGILLRLAHDLKEAGFHLSEATSTEIAEAICSALHGVVSLKITCPAFQTSSAERLTGIIMDSFISNLGEGHLRKNSQKRHSAAYRG
jgi:AcrR family transcriptional regulator